MSLARNFFCIQPSRYVFQRLHNFLDVADAYVALDCLLHNESEDVMSPNKPAKTARSKTSKQRFARGKTPGESGQEVESVRRGKLIRMEVRDDPADPSITPVEPRCRKCGATFSTEAELVEHAKTCKGGHDPGIHHPHRSSRVRGRSHRSRVR
jgi:hypothetical protein